MNICGALIHARSQHSAAVRDRLQALPGVEVHAISPNGRMVVTVEDVGSVSAADSLIECQNIAGVLSTALVYQYNDDSEETG